MSGTKNNGKNATVAPKKEEKEVKPGIAHQNEKIAKLTKTIQKNK